MTNLRLAPVGLLALPWRDVDLFRVRGDEQDRVTTHLATDYELLANAMFCLDDFTAKNGGTRFVPGSCTWAPHRWPERHEIVSAIAPRGVRRQRP